MGLGESVTPIRGQQHLGGQLECSLNASNGAVLFCGISEFRLKISIGTLLFFVPIRAVNHAHISGGSLLYQVERVRVLKRSFLRDAVQANLFQWLYLVVAQAAGVASFIVTAQQKV